MHQTKITEKVKSLIQYLDKEEKIYLLRSFIIMINSIEPILGLVEPLILIIDNQILNDLSHIDTNKIDGKNRTRYIRVISVFMLFNYLLSYAKMNTKIILTPAILFEFNQRSIPENRNDYNILLNKYFSLVEEFGSEILSLGLSKFEDARQKLQGIQRDEQNILAVINRLKQKTMNFEVFDKMTWRDENNKKAKCEIFKPPFIIAHQVASRQKIRLKYFDRKTVNYVIASHLEPKVYSDSAITNLLQQKIKRFRNDSISKTASVSKIEKGQLKGLADIEILQFCNIEDQFQSNTDSTFFAVTFDKKLSELLYEKTRLSLHSEELSSQDDKEAYKAKLNRFISNSKRIDLAQEKQLEALSKLDLFYQHLEPLIC